MPKRTVIRQYLGPQRADLRLPYDWQAREVEPTFDVDGVQVTGTRAFDLSLWGEEQEIDISYVAELCVTQDTVTGDLDAFLHRYTLDEFGSIAIDRDSAAQGGTLVSTHWEHHRVSSIDLLLAQFDLTRTRIPDCVTASAVAT